MGRPIRRRDLLPASPGAPSPDGADGSRLLRSAALREGTSCYIDAAPEILSGQSLQNQSAPSEGIGVSWSVANADEARAKLIELWRTTGSSALMHRLRSEPPFSRRSRLVVEPQADSSGVWAPGRRSRLAGPRLASSPSWLRPAALSQTRRCSRKRAARFSRTVPTSGWVERPAPAADEQKCAIVPSERIWRGIQPAHRGIGRTKLPANKAFPEPSGIRAGHAKSRRSFTPNVTTKETDLQGVSARATGLEPATSGVTGMFQESDDWRRLARNRSIQLCVLPAPYLCTFA